MLFTINPSSVGIKFFFSLTTYSLLNNVDIVGRYVLKRKWPKYFVKVLSHLFSDLESFSDSRFCNLSMSGRVLRKFSGISWAVRYVATPIGLS